MSDEKAIRKLKREAINPPNILIDGVLNYLKKFDKNLMISDLYSDWSEYDSLGAI